MEPYHFTDRLRLALSSPVFAAQAADYYRRNRTFLAPFVPERPESFFTAEGQELELSGEMAAASAGGAYRFYLSAYPQPERIIGFVSLGGIIRGTFQSCFLSYQLDQTLQGQGLMTEAVKACVPIAFNTLHLHRVEANVMPRNAPSLRVLEKAGFRPEGLSQRYLKIHGVWEDHLHWVRLADDGAN